MSKNAILKRPYSSVLGLNTDSHLLPIISYLLHIYGTKMIYRNAGDIREQQKSLQIRNIEVGYFPIFLPHK